MRSSSTEYTHLDWIPSASEEELAQYLTMFASHTPHAAQSCWLWDNLLPCIPAMEAQWTTPTVTSFMRILFVYKKTFSFNRESLRDTFINEAYRKIKKVFSEVGIIIINLLT